MVSVMSRQALDGSDYTTTPWRPDPEEEIGFGENCGICCCASCADALCKSLEMHEVDWLYTKQLTMDAMV